MHKSKNVMIIKVLFFSVWLVGFVLLLCYDIKSSNTVNALCLLGVVNNVKELVAFTISIHLSFIYALFSSSVLISMSKNENSILSKMSKYILSCELVMLVLNLLVMHFKLFNCSLFLLISAMLFVLFYMANMMVGVYKPIKRSFNNSSLVNNISKKQALTVLCLVENLLFSVMLGYNVYIVLYPHLSYIYLTVFTIIILSVALQLVLVIKKQEVSIINVICFAFLLLINFLTNPITLGFIIEFFVRIFLDGLGG